MKTALIFGISGQDGSFLAKFLLEKKYRVVGVSRDVQGSTFANLKKLEIKDQTTLRSASLHDFRSVLQVISQEKPDEIYNLAGQSSVGLSFEQPVETFESISIANLNLLEAIRFLNILGLKLYNAGSSEIYGNTGTERVREDFKLRPRSPYGVAKAAALWQVANYREAYSLYACTGILFNHESYLRPERFVTQKIIKTACRIKKGLEKKLKLGNINIKRDWGWAPEYVEAMWLMLQQEKPDDYIVATGKTYSLENFVSTAFATLDLDWKMYVETDPRLLRPTDIESIYSNPEKAETKLGWTAQSAMPEVVRMMVDKEMSL
ncbi:GDP-mannose 4,6-dehydratase [bacterium]|nr:GDP-mannose 4,6-dehydratase [bacterium]